LFGISVKLPDLLFSLLKLSLKIKMKIGEMKKVGQFDALAETCAGCEYGRLTFLTTNNTKTKNGLLLPLSLATWSYKSC